MTREEAEIVKSAITAHDEHTGLEVDAMNQAACDIRVAAAALLDHKTDREDLYRTMAAIAQRLEAVSRLVVETNAFDDEARA